MKKVNEIIESINTKADNMEFIPTGFDNLDSFLDGGFMRKELIVLGGFTGVGKSYFSGQILLNLALRGFKTAYFSLEISNEMVVSRLIGGLANIKPTKVMSGAITESEKKAKTEAEEKLSVYEANLDFEDNSYSLEEIKKTIIKNKYDFVVIDFIQNLVVEKTQDEYSRLSQATIELQKLAKSEDCCIMVLSQLSNSKGKEGAEKGQIEYKGSGSIATACDLGFFVERSESQSEFNHVTLYLKKNRRGISGFSFNFSFRHPGGWLSERSVNG